LNRRRTTTKNTGTKNTASTVPVIMPPSTPVPMARWLAEPAPLAMASGSTPSTEGHRGHDDGAEAQMRGFQGRLDHPLPWACRSLANSMIKIAFLADRPMMVISPTWKYTSLA
jgi:hypothetical protein